MTLHPLRWRIVWIGFAVACGSSEPAGGDSGTDAQQTSDAPMADAPSSDSAADATPPPADGGSDSPTTSDGGPPPMPLSIPGVAVWLRADYVVLDNTGVARWPDLSPNHDDFLPASTHPPVISNAVNNKPAVDMTIVNTFTGHATTVGTGPVLVEIVVNGVQKNGSAFYGLAANNNSLDIGAGSNGAARAWEATASPVATASSGTVINNATWHILAAQVDGSSNISLRINGAVAGGPTAGANLDLGKLDNTNIGGNVVAELVIVVGAISAGDLGSLEGYLKARYAL